MPGLRILEVPGRFDLAAIQAAHPERYPGLLRTTGSDDGWDILFAFPQRIDRFSMADGLHALTQHPAMRLRPGLPDENLPASLPFTGGWLALFGYELGGLLEPSVGVCADESSFPAAWLARIPAAILRPPCSERCLLLTEQAFARLTDVMRRDVHEAPAPDTSLPGLSLLTEEEPELFLQGVSRIQNYICSGDVFQVNLSRLWKAQFSEAVSPSALFSRLMANNPAPFSALLQFDGQAVVSSSPERLVSVGRGGRIETRPIAGTHPRGQNRTEDESLRSRLAAHPKERAEHIMLVDLERNDLGRVCIAGSVRVAALMDVSSYQYVHHIESTIEGRLRPDVQVFDILRAVFPGGTITGCPKVRTMQIIRELEASPRHAYTGSVGYINHDGSLDFNILIRSFQLSGRELGFRAGAGIVADSEATRELEETRVKARGLLCALGA